MSDIVERHVIIAAPIAHVWKARIQAEQYNSWFGVNLERPFILATLAGSRSAH